MESLCIMTQGIVSQELETVIREAVLGRGVKVYILVPPEFVQTPASYIPALSLLDGVYIRLLHHDEEFLIQDSARVFSDHYYDVARLYMYFLGQWERGRHYQFLASP